MYFFNRYLSVTLKQRYDDSRNNIPVSARLLLYIALTEYSATCHSDIDDVTDIENIHETGHAHMWHFHFAYCTRHNTHI